MEAVLVAKDISDPACSYMLVFAIHINQYKLQYLDISGAESDLNFLRTG
jgi:hypothetical protein